MWVGTVMTTGSSTINVNYSSTSGTNNEITATEFTATGVNSTTLMRVADAYAGSARLVRPQLVLTLGRA